MFVDLRNKLVLVTGGTRGIGHGVVRRLADCGARVAFTYQNEAAIADAMVAELRGADRQVSAYRADISDPDAASALVEQIESTQGPIFALVNNAGITRDKSFLTMPLADWDRVIDVNLNGSAYMARFVLERMIRRSEGKLVNMSSVSGLRASPGQANYAASKAALLALTATLAAEVARFGIQVNAVAPGFIDTDMVGAMPEAAREKLHKRIPLRRMGRVDEVADAVLYLLSQHADYITGQTLVIDGGMSA
ncbi:3-oxoacyl-ACP reductase FabG [Massilia sp. Se16.2.3]|uniref:3-oxoacyl-ACP reductase FabG n=1 Tax=Massilia sp. Se16.2.3 TaxID=2709303 RepID=UPI001602F586|nr:3-oxoacyl-ACP reductase FabG [Massilia sp. Se16.2.3]QNA98230.1 3-oxoacyl-ACP reductase FabG [Massilia sp. Se16.2.3]